MEHARIVALSVAVFLVVLAVPIVALPAAAEPTLSDTTPNVQAPLFEIKAADIHGPNLHTDPGLEVEGWFFTGNLTYRTNFTDPTLGPGQSELTFPTQGTMPLLRLNWYPVVLQYGTSSINQGTSSDSDWIFNTNPTNPVSVTQQSSSGNATFFTGDILLGRLGGDAQFYIGYETHTYNFTWTGPIVLTSCIPSPLIPTCPALPFTEFTGTGPVLTYNATYNGPRVGLVGDWKLSDRAHCSLCQSRVWLHQFQRARLPYSPCCDIPAVRNRLRVHREDRHRVHLHR